MYVETDFLLALAKPDDWLSERAEAFLDTDTDLQTSILALAEFLVVSHRHDIDHRSAVAYLTKALDVPYEDEQLALNAAIAMEEEGATAFDALHAAKADQLGVPLLGSDGVYDDLGVPRVPLEPTGED
ncbi:type II toxin-antitoxin system VapC family toxin [Halogeometricum borinquense]|uniref:Type II toxin-antitoxin system VapC family toxin n=1 Tax=Halogeometricum borinquense TaxID=60847 RepID=A0A482T9X3_9EURY|nr:PIN domain-containing protein [Halogeometricum borinquense]RYJ07753.1 type II toxin-antitoxin system VapC family toxin [Halogeometricum borinquense]